MGFPPSARFQKTQLEDPDHVRLIEAELREVLGADLRFAAIESEEADGEETGDSTEPGAAQPVTHSEIERIHKEPIVSLLKNLFMARLIHIERT